MAATPKIHFLTLVSYSLLQTVFSSTYRFTTIQNVTDRQTARETTDRDRWHSVPKARPIVRWAKKCILSRLSSSPNGARLWNGKVHPSLYDEKCAKNMSSWFISLLNIKIHKTWQMILGFKLGEIFIQHLIGLPFLRADRPCTFILN